MAPAMEAPTLQTIERGLDGSLKKHNAYLVKQHMRGCCARLTEICCCITGKQEYYISTPNTPNENVLYAYEHSNVCCRLFCCTQRPFDMWIHDGPDNKAEKIVHINRPYRCYPSTITFCCNPIMHVYGPKGKVKLGTITIPRYCCTPQVQVRDEKGKLVYYVQRSGAKGCCGGNCCGCCVCLETCKTPFMLHKANGEEFHQVDVKNGASVENVGKVATIDTFGLFVPSDSSGKDRALLLAMIFMLDITYFENEPRDSDKSNVACKCCCMGCTIGLCVLKILLCGDKCGILGCLGCVQKTAGNAVNKA